MQMLRDVQASFSGGEAHPELYGRVDIQKYKTFVKKARNVNVTPRGVLRNRAGTLMVAAAGDSTNKVRLVSFIASSTQAYIIEFGHLYIRFYTNDAQVLSGGVAYQIASPYAAADIFNLKFAQSADVLYIAHPSYQPRTLTFNSSTNWVLAAFTNQNGPFQLQNTDQTSTIAISVPAWAASTAYILQDMVTNGGNTYVCAIAHTSTGNFANDLAAGDWILAPSPSVFTGRNLTLTAAKSIFASGQVGGLFQIQHLIDAQNMAINNNQDGSAERDFNPILCGPTYSFVTAGAWAGAVQIQYSIDNGLTWHVIQTMLSNSTTTPQQYNITGNTGFSQCLLRVIIAKDGNIPGSVTRNGTLNAALTGTGFSCIGVVSITAFNSATSAVGTVTQTNGNSAFIGKTAATYLWSEGSWSTYRGWPTSVTFFQDRSTWASTTTEINTVWFSQVASYTNFGVSVPLAQSDALSVVIPSRQLNSVQAMVNMPQGLLVFTTDSDWMISPGSSGIFSPTQVNNTIQSHRGCTTTDPVVVGNEALIVSPMATVIRNLIFQLAVNGFQGDDVTIQSQHLFTGFTIPQMAYSAEPESIVWVVRSDGKMLSTTYIRAQEMNAWTWHDTQGTFESVAVIPNYTLGINEVWVVVNRTIGGTTTRFIEVLQPRDQGTAPEEQWFMDCAREYDGAAATVITGLSHLNGAAVSILADGNVVANPNDKNLAQVVVANGQITLATAASEVRVGLPYIWDIFMMDIETPNQEGTLQGKRVKIPRAKIRVTNARGGYVSTTDPTDDTLTNFDPLADIMQRDPATNMDTALPLVSGLCDVALPGGYDYSSHINLRGIDPLPFTLNDVVPVVVPGGD